MKKSNFPILGYLFFTVLLTGIFLLAGCREDKGNKQDMVSTLVAEMEPTYLPASKTATSTTTLTPTGTPDAIQTQEAAAIETAVAIAYESLTSPKVDGVYRVGVEIARGEWQSHVEGDDEGQRCYWVRRKYDAIAREEFLGEPGGRVNIQVGDYEVEFQGCGVWEYIEPAE